MREPNDSPRRDAVQGWTWIHGGQKWHHFTDLKSACGHIRMFVHPSSGYDAEERDSPDNCRACVAKLARAREIEQREARLALIASPKKRAAARREARKAERFAKATGDLETSRQRLEEAQQRQGMARLNEDWAAARSAERRVVQLRALIEKQTAIVAQLYSDESYDPCRGA
jgi:hypothetical protein